MRQLGMVHRESLPSPLLDAADRSRRTVAEPEIEQLLLLSGCTFALRQGAIGEAEDQVRDALERLVERGLPFVRDDRGTRHFDPAEVINFLAWCGLRGDAPFWRAHCVATARALALSFADAGPPSPARFTVTLHRMFGTAGPPGRGTRLRLPLPIEDAHLTDLAIVPILPERVEAVIVPGRIEARLTDSPSAPPVIGACLTFTADPGGPHTDARMPADQPLYLCDTEGLIQITPTVRALATRLAGDLSDPLAALAAFRDFILDDLFCGIIQYDRIGSRPALDWVLETGWFDCRIGAALLIALCRARGIPARLIGGNLLYALDPSEHYWAEIWIDDQGWTPFDLHAWNLSAGGTDAAWRAHFNGAIDYRMKTQCFPRIFTGLSGMAFPAAWHRLSRATADGIEARFVGIDGALIHHDTISVTRLPAM
jgi:hypothetical protein